MRSMESKTVLDTNAVLRYLLGDIEQQYHEVEQVIGNRMCIVPLEVIAEAVYVLEKIYRTPRYDIIESFRKFADDVIIPNSDVMLRGMGIFGATPKMDFVDCLMYGYKMARGYDVLTFDRTLRKRLETIALPGDDE